jgi:2-amino-4-hydroxy-6-hydroxymethyldihydropteridine diphosphokinase
MNQQTSPQKAPNAPHHILISVGSNIDKELNTKLGLQALYEQFGDLSLSTIYESESVGFSGNNFINLVVSAHTKMSIAQVCATLKELEDLQGRTRDKKFGNRTLDLDLLTFDDTICENPVTLPRAEILYNAFVLKPMADLVPNQHHPVVHKTYAQLWEHFVSTSENNTQQLWPTDLPWSASTK